MADYVSQFTGEEIDSAVNLIVNSNSHHNGDVLISNGEGGYTWGPAIDADNAGRGDVLIADGNGDYSWGSVIDTTGAGTGDVLTYNGNGSYIWSPAISTSGAEDGDILKYNSYNGSYYWSSNSVSLEDIDHSNANQGSVLVYQDGSLTWGSPIDMTGSGFNTCLMTSDTSGHYYWGSPFPSYNSDDAGKVLMVNSEGDLEWTNIDYIISNYSSNS